MPPVLEKSKFDIFNFTPPGPVCQAYINSTGPIDLIRGPWGSGKTVGTVFKIAYAASILYPVCTDGIVHVRCAAIRDTYRELAKTALQSWHEFFPKNGAFTKQPVRENYSGGQDRPVKHVVSWDVIRQWPDGPRKTQVELEMEFGAIGDQNLDSFFKGYEISMGWVNECDLLNKDVPARLYGRTGRYPPTSEIMPWEGERLGYEVDPVTGLKTVRLPRIVCGDFNPPDESNWTYEREIENREKWADTHNFFAQPSGLSPQAENRRGKSRQKYEEEERAFGGPTSPEARRNVHGEYAAKVDGTVIFANFSLNRHRSTDLLEPVPELPFYIGSDAGGTPAAGIGQFMPNGQFRALREITTTPKEITGPQRFAEMIADVLLRDFRGMRCGGAWGDPAAWYGVDKQRGELAFMQIVAKALSIPFRPTDTNDFKSRFEAVDFYLKGLIDANTPRALFDPRLKVSIRGLVSQYKTTKQFSEGKSQSIEIANNEYTHVQDAWQYLLLGYRGGARVKADAAQIGRAANVVSIANRVRKGEFNVHEL
ncbi:MAG: hypothetical protein ACRCU5_13900 [Rhizobiaceae bacterium]